MANIIVIPARMGSKRLPEKPLCPINGVPMVVRVAQQAAKSRLAEQVIVATDSAKILKAVLSQKYPKYVTSILTPQSCRTGTDRIAALSDNFYENDVIVNLQGDLPFCDPRIVDQLFTLMAENRDVQMATACNPKNYYNDSEDFHSPHSVKVVFDWDKNALLFSRSPIPHGAHTFYHHFGVYAYRPQTLRFYANANQPEIEQLEQLEQLRALRAGIKIRILVTEYEAGQEINTREDLNNVK